MKKKDKNLMHEVVMKRTKIVPDDFSKSKKNRKQGHMLVCMKRAEGFSHKKAKCKFCKGTVFYDDQNGMVNPDAFCCNECFFERFIKDEKTRNEVDIYVTETTVDRVADKMIEDLDPKEARKLLKEIEDKPDNYAM